MKLLGVLSPVKNSTVSLDLLNLYVVNQISCQKRTLETVRKPIHVDMNRGIKMPLRKHDLELPMSPPSVPSNLCIDDLESNIHYQRLGSKEELGPVQLRNVNYSNSLISKLNESQDALSPSCKTAQFGTLFETLNSPGNRKFLTGRPAAVMSEDCGSMDERRHSDFITEKQSIQHIWGKNSKEVSNFFEDVNQPNSSFLPENFDSFINENVINLLSIDQQRITKPFDKCGYDSVGDIFADTSSDKNHSSDRCIRSTFTDPELNFSSFNFNKTNYPEKCQTKKYQKEYNNNEGNNPSTSFEKYCSPASSEKKGKFERNYQEKKPQIEIQKYPVDNMSTITLEELHSKKSWDFGLGENLMEGGTCCIKGTPTFTKKICQYNNLDSSQSSHSSSYSPRPTDSCFSSTSEMPSEDEDQTSHQIEDSSRRCIKTEETTNNFYLERLAEFPCDKIVKNTAKIHKQKESFHQVSVKNSTDQFAQSQCNSTHVLRNQTSNSCILQSVRCDAWVQTESEFVMKERLDAAIQCDIISECKCRNDVTSLCNVESCSDNIKADTTGGQEILRNNENSQISA
ncbi:regulator of DNA class I crossover intermediates 1 [Molossus nigricans]